jgi:hypothetical protein
LDPITQEYDLDTHAEHVVYRPKMIFSDTSQSKRIHNEMWTGNCHIGLGCTTATFFSYDTSCCVTAITRIEGSTIQLIRLNNVRSDCLAAMSKRQYLTLKGFWIQAWSSERVENNNHN